VVPDDKYDGKPGGIGGTRGERHRLRGPSRIDTTAPPRPVPTVGPGPAGPVRISPAPQKTRAAKKRVLFVCIGNSCRSQMAEAFAKAYGSDIMDVHSAGVSPATMIAPLTKQTLAERNLNIDGHFPKGLELIQRMPFDVVVNMSGIPLSLPGARVLDWVVPDPIGQRDEVYRTVANQLEGLVMRLILELRTAR
jgi:arsenate reductase